MTPAGTKKFLILASLVLVLVFLAVAQFASPMHIRFESTTAALSLITASAIGIERLIELFWTYIGQTRGSWWPLRSASEQINGMVSDFDELLKPVYDQVNGIIEKGAGLGIDGGWPEERVKAAKAELDKLEKNLRWIQQLAPDNQRLQLVAAQAYQNISYLNAKYPGITNTAAVAGQAITGVTDFVATFKDNPGRRMISICFGAFIGLIVAWAAGMDVFAAAGEVTLNTGGTGLFPYVGIALTGVLIGLGSNPTHEVIRVLQEMKKNRTLANMPAPELGSAGEAAPAVTAYREINLGGNGGDLSHDVTATTTVQTPPRKITFSTFTLRK